MKKELSGTSGRKPFWHFTRRRVILWILAALICGIFSGVTLIALRGSLHRDPEDVYLRTRGNQAVTLMPGETASQTFRAMGNLTGEITAVLLDPAADQALPVKTSVRILDASGEVLARAEAVGESLNKNLSMPAVLSEPTELQSHSWYRIEVTNTGDSPLKLRCNPELIEGSFSLEGEDCLGWLNLGLTRESRYAPSWLTVLVLVALTDLVVLLGLALVLFASVGTHTLYLILALGFGFVMLFDLTPVYGFDMQFQYDSTYVLSNEILGLGGPVAQESAREPGQPGLFYERRICDDLSNYQFQHKDTLTDNYTDNRAGLSLWKAPEQEQAMTLVETYQGMVGEQLYLFLPQALGFSLARVLGLGLFPMLLLGRLFSYGFFVLAAYFAIRLIPFGKKILLILCLTPAVLIQTLSINRDGMILALSFLLIGLVLKAAYQEKKTDPGQWVGILALSAVLAPCKMVYLPLSFFWILILMREHEQGKLARDLGKAALFTLVILGFFILANIPSIQRMAQPAAPAAYAEPTYTVAGILGNPVRSLYVVLNTYRQQLGSYLTNALQLFDIEAGSSDGLTLLILGGLVLAACLETETGKKIRPLEKGLFFLIILGVLGLLTLASFQWTTVNSIVIWGLQGRYLTPVLPLLFFMAAGNGLVRVDSRKGSTLVDSLCCIFPAVLLMNMFLWTVRL